MDAASQVIIVLRPDPLRQHLLPPLETATAVAVRRTDSDSCEVAASLGLCVLTQLILKPAERFAAERRHIYDKRVLSKEWKKTWPLLREKPV